MSRCPHCGARGVKIADERDVQGMRLRFDYCGSCGKNWPSESTVPADQMPPAWDEVITTVGETPISQQRPMVPVGAIQIEK